MITSIWNTIVYEPLYNLLIFFVGIFPGHSVGLAIIMVTIIVKVAMYPLTSKAIHAQRAMKDLEPLLKGLRDKHKNDKQKLAQQTMALYQEHGVSPFSGCLPMFIQIPFIIGLYFVFLKGLDVVNLEILYSFVQAPLSLDMHFLVFDLSGKSISLAFLAGLTQYYQTSISLGKQVPLPENPTGIKTFQEDFTRSMQTQIRYVLPVIIAFVAYTTSTAVALYWVTSNILSIVQEVSIRKSWKK